MRGFLNPHILFQSTPSQRGRHSDTRLVSQYNGISIHALAKRATSRLAEASAVPIISIHALAKRATKYIKKINQRLAISIHALAKRATFQHLHITLCSHISIHALAKRATIISPALCIGKIYFNPRPRKEGDHCRSCQTCIRCYFNPRPRKEGDAHAL